MIRLTVTIITALGMSLCQGFTLELTPSGTHVTERVVLTCHYGGRTSINGSIKSMRILKESESNHWKLISEIEANKTTNSFDNTVITTGLIKKLNDSFLTVSWPLVTDDVPGRYRCDIVGFTNRGDYIWEKTDEVFVSERNFVLQSILKLMKEEKENTKRDLAAITKRIDEIGSVNLSKSIEQLSEFVYSSIIGRQLRTESKKNLYWPGGSFGLLATSSGCPSNYGGYWLTGYLKHHTESSNTNHNNVSHNSHLQKPLFEISRNNLIFNNFMYQHFCLINSTNWDVLWPQGTYCINMHNGMCPFGFDSGIVYWDDEDTDASSATNGALPTGKYYASSSYIYYCCRSDGAAITPVHLPKDKPFYLYRYHGLCQQVVGMNATEEFMHFDTENSQNQDKFYSHIHPDGQAAGDVKLQLCYYEPA